MLTEAAKQTLVSPIRFGVGQLGGGTDGVASIAYGSRCSFEKPLSDGEEVSRLIVV